MDEVFAAITAWALVIALTVSGSIAKAVHVGYALSLWFGRVPPRLKPWPGACRLLARALAVGAAVAGTVELRPAG
jgi:hypothetical protein